MKKSLLTLAALLLAVVANAAENLWASAQVTSSFYYAPGWNQIADPVLNVENGTYSYTLPQATFETWQAQVYLATDIAVSSKKDYDFSMTITSSKAVNATIKLYEKGKDNESFFTENKALVAGEATRVEHLSMKGMDLAALCLLVDVGGNYENTTITISDVSFSEGAEPIVGKALTDEGADANGVHKLSGTWDVDQFKAIDAESKANAYDFTNVSDLPDAINNQNVCANPNTFFISPRAGHFLFNEVVKDGDNGYRGYNIQLIDHFANTNDHSVNTSVAPITVVSPLFQRVTSRGNIYSTVVLPFVQATMPTTVKFYGLDAVTTEGDITKIVFKEESPEAGVPYLAHLDGADIYMAGSGEEKTITWATSEKNVAGASFVPTFASVEAADGQYILDEGEELSAKKNESAVKAFTAYLLLPTVGSEIQVSVATSTGVRQIDAAAIATLFNVYSIDGKLVKSKAKSLIGLKQGLYVINGKKVMVK